VYHQGYCLLLLTLPLTAVVADRTAPPWVSHPGLRRALFVALAIPMINYLPSGTAIDTLGITGTPWLVITSLNGTCLVVAMAVYLWLAFQPGTSGRTVRAADLPRSQG
jgi:uroporphyrinogen-III synthase